MGLMREYNRIYDVMRESNPIIRMKCWYVGW